MDSKLARIALGLLVAGALSVAARAEDRFVARLPADDALEVRTSLVYERPEGAELAFDLYRPAGRSGRVPVVVFLNGIGADWMRSHAQYVGWARAVTARGLAGVTMDSREGAIEEDLRSLLHYLETHAGELGVDPGRVALWSCSSNARVGLPLSQSLEGLAAAVVYYGTGEVESFRRDRPLLVARAGLDNADLNRAIDAWVVRALADNAPIEVLNLPGAPHGFDVRLDSDVSRTAIAKTLDFLERALTTDWVAAVGAGAARAAAASAVYGERWREAVAAYEGLTRDDPEDPLLWESLGRARLELGESASALAALERALELGSPNQGRVSFLTVRLLTEVGKLDRAFERLESMKRWLRFFVDDLRTDPAFAPLRADPRFEELLAGGQSPAS